MHINIKHKASKLAHWGAALAVAGGMVTFTTGAASAAGTEDFFGGKPGFCIPFDAPVALGAGQPYNQRVKGTYCQPFKWAKDAHNKTLPHQVDVLTAGASYTSSYWDWPVQPGTYSFVNKTLSAGRATVAYDRIGSGKSSHPVSTNVTLDSDAYVLHSIVQVLRLGGYGYPRVNSIGHSYSSGVVLQEASVYKDVSRVVVTGYLHNPRDPAVGSRNYPANQDPMFASSGFDDGYLTSRPDTRGLSFYNTAAADPAVIAYDEAHKDVISRTAFLGYAAQQGAPVATNVSTTITVPVIVAVGQQDAIFCVTPATLNCASQSAVQAYEAPFYAASSNFKAFSVPNTGHDLALHPSTSAPNGGSFKTISDWLNKP